jgi:hypothetical protein
MTIINALPFNLQNGTTADASQVMANFNEIVNDTNLNGAKNGVNSDITSLTALNIPIPPAVGGSSIFYGAGSGTANAQIVSSLTPTGFTLTAGYSVYWIPSVSNTGALTLNANGTGAKAVTVQTASGVEACIGGEVIIGQLAKATYDGTQFVLDLDTMAGFGTLLNLASATTTDLGTALSHTVNVTGTVTITGFGSSASLQRPLYKLTFSGILILTYNATSLILPGSTSITTAVGDTCDALYLGSGNWQVVNYARRNGQPLNFPANFLQNYLTGLTLSTAGSSGTFGIAAGEAADSTNVILMLLNSAYTKTTASWAVGSGNGAIDTGAIAGSTWYHVYLIERVDTGVVDVLFSLSATSPTMPTNYTLFRRIGSMKTDGSNHWILFTQTGDQFIWNVRVLDANSTSVPNTRTNVTLTVPTGVVVNALFSWFASPGGSGTNVLITSLQESDQAPSNQLSDIIYNAGVLTTQDFARLTDTSARISVRGSSAVGAFSINTYGWIDTRGKN